MRYCVVQITSATIVAMGINYHVTVNNEVLGYGYIGHSNHIDYDK